MTRLGPRRVAAVVLLGVLLAVLHVGGLARGDWQLLDGRLSDPDAYMRLVRVSELRAGEGWYDAHIERANAPLGQAMHWTRPFDALLLAGGLALTPLLGFDDGLFVFAALSGPLLHFGALVLLLWGAAALLPPQALAATAAMALFQAGISTSFLASRPDHHGLQALLFAGLIGVVLRLLRAPESRRLALAAGLLAAISVWVSVEGLIAAGLAGLLLAAAWAARGGQWLGAGLTFALAAAAGAALALVLERPPIDWATLEYDRISAPHLALFDLQAVLWLGLWAAARRLPGPASRTLTVAAGGATALALVLFAFPKLAGGPMVDVPERVLTLWLVNVSEVASVWSAPHWPRKLYLLLLYLGICLPALPYMAVLARRESGGARWGWGLLLLATAIYFALALHQLRWAVYAELAALPAFGRLALATLERLGLGFAPGRRPLLRVLGLTLGRLGLLFLFGLGFAAVAWAVKPTAGLAEAAGLVRACDLGAPARLLADPTGLGDRPRRVLAYIFDGPELLYRTPHAVVATPYHGNGAGILDAFDFFSAADPATAEAIARRRGLDLVLFCAEGSERLLYEGVGGPTLLDRLADGVPPPWLVRLPLPPALASWRLYRVEP